MSKVPTQSETVQKIWGATLQAGDDPVLTVHRLPEADRGDLEALGRTLQPSDGSGRGRRSTEPATCPVSRTCTAQMP